MSFRPTLNEVLLDYATNHEPTVDKPWTHRGSISPGRGQGCSSSELVFYAVSFRFCPQSALDPCPSACHGIAWHGIGMAPQVADILAKECPRGMPVSVKGMQVSVKVSGLKGALIRTFGPWVWYPSCTGLWTHRVYSIYSTCI